MNFANSFIQDMGYYSPPLDGRRAYKGELLDFNERTLPVPDSVKQAFVDYALKEPLHLYPEYGDTEARVADFAGVEAEQLILTNGSNQGIDLVFRTFTRAGDKVLIPEPSFSMYRQCAGLQNVTVLSPEYRWEAPHFPYEEVETLLKNQPIKLMVLCNPNNPTGSFIPLDGVEALLNMAPATLFLVDEAYAEFSGRSAAGLIKSYPNLIIARTFSKAFGLPALRVAYLMSQAENLKEILKAKGPYDINMPAIVAVRASLKAWPEIQDYIRDCMEVAKPQVEAFFRKQGIDFLPSAANFICFRPQEKALTLFNGLDAAGFKLRPRKEAVLQGCLRVSIGTSKQMEDFLKSFAKLA